MINIGNNTAFSTSKIMKFTEMRKNYNVNGRRAEFPGSNTHSSGDISSWSSFGIQTVNWCSDHLSYAFFLLSQHFNSGSDRLVFEVPHSHTIRNTHTLSLSLSLTLARIPLNEWSARRRGRYSNNRSHTQKTKILAPGEIQTRNPNHRTAADLCLRQLCHRDRSYSKHRLSKLI